MATLRVAREFASANSASPKRPNIQKVVGKNAYHFLYPSGDNFGTFSWPGREEIESLLVCLP